MKCTPEEAAAMAERAGINRYHAFDSLWLPSTSDMRLIIDLAREPLQARLEVLAAQIAELREALIYHQEQTRPIFQTDEALAHTAPDSVDGETT